MINKIVKTDKYGELEKTETTSFLPSLSPKCLCDDKNIISKISMSQRNL